MASDYGINAAGYTADVTDTGLIGKIAKQVLESEEIPYLFDSLSKGMVKYGKDIEVALIKAATGKEPTADEVDAEKSTADVLYFKNWTPRVYSALIDYEAIDDAAQSAENAERHAALVIDSMYQGASKEKNMNAVAAFAGAMVGIGTGTARLVKVGDVAEITDETTARTFLSTVKKVAKKVRRGSPSVNVKGLDVPANRVVMITPADNVTQVDVYQRIEAKQLDYARFDVDEIIEYDADKYSALNGATFIIDDRYAQFHEKARRYRERDVIGADNGGTVKAALNTRDMYAICPLFNAVMIGQL
jgi:hypothetical protein